MSIADKRASFARRAESLVERKYNISTEKCGDLTVIVQGDLSQQEKRAVFITVHDLGCNHNSFQEFVSSPCMTEIKERSCFIHVDVPGHADHAEALADGFPFPTLQSLGEDLVTVLDYLHVKYVIGLGEGAGANVLARFGLAHPSRVLGLILINATGSAASVLQSFKNKFISWKSDEVAQSAESFLMYHKFGHVMENWQIVGENPDKEKIVAEYQKRLHRSLNSKNIGLYVKAFMNRKDLTLKGCKVDVILITGMLSPYASMVEKLHRDVEKERVTILKIERAGDVLADAPGKVAQSILLFCKGQGLLTSVVMPGVDRGRAFSTASSGSFEGANGSRRLSRGISMEDYDKPNIRRLSIMNTKHIFAFNSVYMDAPPPTKPPRGVKYGKDESAGCGFLVNVIKSLGFSETTEERQKEKQKIEAEFKRSDLRLNELVSRHDQQLTQVLPLFSQVSSEVTASRERIHAVKENLGVCKRLLQCRRDELRKMWTDAVQHKYVLEMLEQIQELRKVPQRVVGYTSKRQYLHASKALTDALATLNGPLQAVEGLSDLRTDLQARRQQLYLRLHEELVTQVYTNSANEALSSFERTNSSRLNSSFTRGIKARRSTDRIEANARVRKALAEMAQRFDLDKAEVIEDADLIYPELSMSYFVAIIVESFGMLHKVPDSLETLRVQIQTELLNVVRNTTHLLSVNGATADTNPLLTLLEVIFKQFKAIAKTHTLLLKNYLSVGQKYSVVGPQPYDLTDFWAQAQSVLQLLLTDYLDIQNAASDESAQTGFSEPTSNINSYFLRRKVPSTKGSMFKFDKSSHVGTSSNSDSLKEHRRNASDASVDDNLAAQLGGSGKGSTSGLFRHEKKQREKILICTPDQNIITKVYLPLMGYIKEIENFMKCKPGQPCSLHDFLNNYIKDTFLSKGHNRNLQLTIESLSKNQDAWRTIISPEEIKALNLSRPLLQSTVMVERRLMETRNLIQDLPCYSEDLLKMVCALLKAYREICQAAYRGIVQPDSEDKRIYSVAWLKDEDISRFLKTLPNWTDLKTSSQKSRHNRKLHRGSFEPSEEESPLQVQQRNIREAEMLTSNLGEGGITQQEILVDISVLKELAILQESMEWFSCRVSEFANDLRRPLVNGLNAVSAECGADIAVKDGTIKVMTNLALEFDELANTCLLVLHLEVRVQCFHYLRSKSSVRTNSYVGSKDDILEPDRQVQVLTKRLSEMDEAFSATLHPRKTRYIFEGLAHLASRILIQASNYLEHIDQITVQRMCRNAISLQQTLSNITASREVALDQARHFYELLCMQPDEILNALLERGTQFSEMQLLNALQLSCKSFGITDANLLASYQQKLSDILGAKPSKGVIV
ncbi:exocyst complex component 4 isoform X6 [Drosophila yakuba]|uniref:exocyst complex component 4 isoform X6 n=1 Tax=Drosophila yakuba TaxID=7245 RepID=UPI0019307B6F|nr:exocyst complex component 4 isoform X6 [Drosophila yakuba]